MSSSSAVDPNNSPTYASAVQKGINGIFCALSSQKDWRYLPPDVRLLCKDGETLDGHKLIFALFSDFFRAHFRQSNEPKITVDLRQFDKETIELLLQWLYTGEPPSSDILSAKIESVIILADFLLVDFVVDPYCKLIDDSLNAMYVKSSPNAADLYEYHCNPPSPDRLMDWYVLATNLGNPKLRRTVEPYFLCLADLPGQFFALALPSTMLWFLHSIDSSSLSVIRSVCGLPALQLERYILNLVIRYIKANKAERLQHATDLFSTLKLAYIAKELDFDRLELPELEDKQRFAQLHTWLDMCRDVDDDFNFECVHINTKMPSMFWHPRPRTIKYSIWSRRHGNYKARVERMKKDDGQEVGVTFKRFAFERCPGVRLTRLDVFPTTVKNGHTIIGGLRLYWSDQTIDEAGQVTGQPCSVKLAPNEGVSVRLNSGEFVERILFCNTMFPYTPTAVHGPYGRQYEDDGRTMYDSPMCSLKAFEDNLYLDGIKGFEVIRAGSKPVCTLSFKMSLLANTSLEHYFAETTKSRKKSQEDHEQNNNCNSKRLTLAFLKQHDHIIRVGHLKNAAKCGMTI